jgi:pantoate--beta-alanine ligase
MAKTPTRSKHHRRVIRALPALKRAIADFRARRCKIALVPTMGALHAGHLALVRAAQRRADRVIVSIFVNPAQFAPHEDLKTYPQTFAADITALAALKADLVWAPTAATMYPSGGLRHAHRAGRPGECRPGRYLPAALLRRRGNSRR